MSKDVILDRYARLYEIPYQLARLGHNVKGFCLDYYDNHDLICEHKTPPGRLTWESTGIGNIKLLHIFKYPYLIRKQLHKFSPDILIGASDIPHVALTSWLAKDLNLPYVTDLYDNFESFPQAKLPFFRQLLRSATRQSNLVITTSDLLRDFVVDHYVPSCAVIPMPSSVDLDVFNPGNKYEARKALGLPSNAILIGTAGGLYPEKGIIPIYTFWERAYKHNPNMHLVLAGPYNPSFPPPELPRIHYLGNLEHSRIADLFRALDVGIISVLETPFGEYCFPQKAYEMIATKLPIAAANIGAMSELFRNTPSALFKPNNSESLEKTIYTQLRDPQQPGIEVPSWSELIKTLETLIKTIHISTGKPQAIPKFSKN